jgi:hypothetical protein
MAILGYTIHMPDVFTSKKVVKKPAVSSKKMLYKDMPMQDRYPLASFLMIPSGVNFETKEHDEKIIMFLRKHIITNIPWVIMAALMFVTPTLVSMLSILDPVPENFRFVFYMIWYLITTAYVLESFLTWFFNVYLVTDERIKK